MSSCAHPDDRLEIRKFPPTMGGPMTFAVQCLECLDRIGRPLDRLALPDGVRACDVQLAKLVRKDRGRTGLGGRGNSKRRRYEKYLRSAAWRGKNGVRNRVLERDRDRCVDCGEPATCVAHITYPDEIERTTPSHCKASCDECNANERSSRIARAVLGGMD